MSQTNLPKRLKAAGARAGARGRSNDLLAGARAERAKDRGRSGPVRSGNKAVRRGLNSSLAGGTRGRASERSLVYRGTSWGYTPPSKEMGDYL